MKIIITPNDAVCFGRGKSTQAGEASFGSMMFPPNPTVFLGAVRSAFLSQNPEYIPCADIPGKDPTADTRITFCSLYIGGEAYFPAPADTVIPDGGDNRTPQTLRLMPNDGLSCHKLPYYLWAGGKTKVKNTECLLLSAASLNAYLSGISGITAVPLSEYIMNEPRIGIARDNALHAAADSMLYNSPLTRYTGGFAAELTGGGLPKNEGVIRLGKHGKTARYKQTDFSADIKCGMDTGGFFKLYLAAPAVFTHGSQPDLPGGLPDVELIAAAVTGYVNTGGYDMRLNLPKPMKRAVKAGSVYYYRLKSNTEENRAVIKEKLHNKCISAEQSQAGLGLCYIGKADAKGE